MNFLGVIGQLGRLLPGYVQGQRQAYEDNWNDLNQFNQVQQGQIGNAFLEATFPLEYNNAYNNAINSSLATKLNAANATKFMQSLPYELQIGAMQGQYAPLMLQQQVAQALNPGLRALQTAQAFGVQPQSLFGQQQGANAYDSTLQALVQRISVLENALNGGQQPLPGATQTTGTPTNWAAKVAANAAKLPW